MTNGKKKRAMGVINTLMRNLQGGRKKLNLIMGREGYIYLEIERRVLKMETEMESRVKKQRYGYRAG